MFTPTASFAEKLPIKTYTTADGLAHNNVNRIVRDSRGFLWFCTFEGLSRFDGYSFTTYGSQQGLPSQVINDLLETREGLYWVATSAGLCLFNPKGNAQRSSRAQGARASTAMFTVYFPAEDARSSEVTSLLQDNSGGIWCGTARGLYRMEQDDRSIKFQFVELGLPAVYGESRNVTSLARDRRGGIWVGSNNGIYRLLPDGRAEHYNESDGLSHTLIQSVLVDREDRVWAATRNGGLCLLVFDPDHKVPPSFRAYTLDDGLPVRWINQVFQASDGTLWAASPGGLTRLIPSADVRSGFRFRTYTQANGLSSPNVQALSEDRNGNLWIGMANGGAARLARSGITTFSGADGFNIASAIFRDRDETLYVVAGPDDRHRQFLINRFDGERFTPVQLKFSPQVFYGWGWNQLVSKDRAGEWWVATGSGLYRFPKVSSFEHLARASPVAVYTKRDGLASDEVLRLFEDSRGDIWVGTANEGGLSRWNRANEKLIRYTEQDSLPSLKNYYPISFAEDRAGAVWIGFSIGGGLVRYRDGSFTRFTSGDGLPDGGIFSLFLDSFGRLWAPTTRGGVCRIDHPEADRPAVITYTTNEGLSSNDVKAVTEDRLGRIYLGTGRGIDRLNPETGNIRHYTANEGALLGDVQAALQDRDGALWFSYTTGLVRLVPEVDTQSPSPTVLITGLRIAGEIRQVSELGESSLAPIELGANNNDLQIDFVAPGTGFGEAFRYQYVLEGSNQDWSAPSDQRRVNFANLAPGHYRFLVRALNSDNLFSENPASLVFTIVPPLWQRWWFVIAAVALTAAIAFWFYRYRVTRLLEIERVRTRIAADLHDDIGSNLSQIAIWSDVAQRQIAVNGDQRFVPYASESPSPLDRIATTARETASSMSDIVWAINPRRDYLSDLVSRMRRFAGETFDYRGIVWQFEAPQLRLGLDADTRREVFLIFKEAVNNIVRHANSARVEISLSIEKNRLMLHIQDDGCGFDAHLRNGGHGLMSVRERAASLRGSLKIESSPGTGTMVALELPLDRSRRRR